MALKGYYVGNCFIPQPLVFPLFLTLFMNRQKIMVYRSNLQEHPYNKLAMVIFPFHKGKACCFLVNLVEI